MENALRACPWDLREAYERELAKAHKALGEAQLQIKTLKKLERLLGSSGQP